MDITDNVYNPQNQAAYAALDEKEEEEDVSFCLIQLLGIEILNASIG